MKKNLYTIIVCILAVGLISGCSKPFNKTFGGSNYEYVYSVMQTSDGGYILAGWTYSFGAGFADAWLIKTDADGNKVWDKTFGGSGHDEAYAVQQTSDGGYILAGHTDSYGAGNFDAWLIKTDADGNKVWDKTFGGSGNDSAYAVQQTSDGGYILAGCTYSFGAGSYDAWLIKTVANGIKDWDKTFGGTDYDEVYAVQQTSDGGYILAGYTESFGAGLSDAWLIKTSSIGYKLWDKTYGGTGYDEVHAVQQTNDGGYILAGATSSIGAGSYDAWLIKTNGNGNYVWDKTFGGSGNDSAHAVQQTRDGGYILAANQDSWGTTKPDAWLIKTDANGNNYMGILFGGYDLDYANAVQQTRDGGYILAGYTASFGAGSWDAWLIKTDANGHAPATP